LDSSDFLPLRECGHWSRLHLATQLSADVALFAAGLVGVILLALTQRRQATRSGASPAFGSAAPFLVCLALLGLAQLMEAVVFF
jgi:hypothetical protein